MSQINTTGNVCMNVTLRHVLATIVIAYCQCLCVCVCVCVEP